MRSNLLIPILSKLNKVKSRGISSYRLALSLGESEPAIRHHLKKLKEGGIVRKRLSKYYLNKTGFHYNGMLILEFPSEGFIFLGCKYQNECSCSPDEECKMIKELPDWLKERMYADE